MQSNINSFNPLIWTSIYRSLFSKITGIPPCLQDYLLCLLYSYSSCDNFWLAFQKKDTTRLLQIMYWKLSAPHKKILRSIQGLFLRAVLRILHDVCETLRGKLFRSAIHLLSRLSDTWRVCVPYYGWVVWWNEQFASSLHVSSIV